MENLLNFSANFVEIFQIFQKSSMSTFLQNVLPPEPKFFCDAIAVQDLNGNHLLTFVRCFPPSNQNFGAAPDHIYIIWLM